MQTEIRYSSIVFIYTPDETYTMDQITLYTRDP